MVLAWIDKGAGIKAFAKNYFIVSQVEAALARRVGVGVSKAELNRITIAFEHND
jgi:hypothetical protein